MKEGLFIAMLSDAWGMWQAEHSLPGWDYALKRPLSAFLGSFFLFLFL
jgi:hypothetical protein